MGPLTGDSCLLILGGVPGRYLLVDRATRGETPFGSSYSTSRVVGGCWGVGGVLYVPSSLLSVKVALGVAVSMAGMSGNYPSCLSGEGLCHLEPVCPPAADSLRGDR